MAVNTTNGRSRHTGNTIRSRSGVVWRELKGEVEAETLAVLLSLAELLNVTLLE